MKKFNGIILFVLVVLLVGFIIVKAETNIVNEETISGMVYGETGSTVYDWLEEWVSIYDEEARKNTIDDNMYYKGFGVIDAYEFEEEFQCSCTLENIEKVEKEHFDLEHYDVKLVGFYEDYNVYKMEAKSNTTPIGYEYVNGVEVNYYGGYIYFMVYWYDYNN